MCVCINCCRVLKLCVNQALMRNTPGINAHEGACAQLFVPFELILLDVNPNGRIGGNC